MHGQAPVIRAPFYRQDVLGVLGNVGAAIALRHPCLPKAGEERHRRPGRRILKLEMEVRPPGIAGFAHPPDVVALFHVLSDVDLDRVWLQVGVEAEFAARVGDEDKVAPPLTFRTCALLTSQAVSEIEDLSPRHRQHA